MDGERRGERLTAEAFVGKWRRAAKMLVNLLNRQYFLFISLSLSTISSRRLSYGWILLFNVQSFTRSNINKAYAFLWNRCLWIKKKIESYDEFNLALKNIGLAFRNFFILNQLVFFFTNTEQLEKLCGLGEEIPSCITI